MHSVSAERKEAVRLYYYEGHSKAEVCRQLGRSRPWVDRWLDRYEPGDVERSLRNRAPGPAAGQREYSSHIQQQVLAMRARRMDQAQQPYTLYGAAAIHYELKALGSDELPSIRTIHRWLKEAGYITSPAPAKPAATQKPIPLPEAERVNHVQQLDLKGPLYLQGSSQKHYLIVLCDCFSRRCALHVVTRRKAHEIVDFLVATWQWFGLPAFLQMDNALEFRGSNRYPRSFGQVVRLALDVGVEPVFIPPREPWRNGCVERLNGFLQTHLCTIEHANLAAFRSAARSCQKVRNHKHRLACLEGDTPYEVAAQADLRLLESDYQRHQRRTLPQEQGFVSFVRLVRHSGRITLGAGDRFMVDPQLAYSYVRAQVQVAEQVVAILHEQQPLLIYGFDSATVGAWAMDDPS